MDRSRKTLSFNRSPDLSSKGAACTGTSCDSVSPLMMGKGLQTSGSRLDRVVSMSNDPSRRSQRITVCSSPPGLQPTLRPTAPASARLASSPNSRLSPLSSSKNSSPPGARARSRQWPRRRRRLSNSSAGSIRREPSRASDSTRGRVITPSPKSGFSRRCWSRAQAQKMRRPRASTRLSGAKQAPPGQFMRWCSSGKKVPFRYRPR